MIPGNTTSIFLEKIEKMEENREKAAISFIKSTSQQNIQEKISELMNENKPLHIMNKNEMDNILRQMILSRSMNIRETVEKSISIALGISETDLQRTLEKEQRIYNQAISTITQQKGNKQ